MANFTDFPQETTLLDDDELVGLYGNESDEFRIALRELRGLLSIMMNGKPAGEPWLFVSTGQSILTGGWPATGMVQNTEIRDWVEQSQGGGFSWHTPDPAGAAIGGGSPGMGYRQDNTGFYPWSMADFVQRLTGRRVYMISAYFSGASVDSWAYYGPDGVVSNLLTTQYAAALAAESSLPAQPDAFVWSQAFADSQDNPFVWAEKVIDFFRYMEDPNSAWAVGGEPIMLADTPKIFMDMPVTDNNVLTSFSGPRVVCDLLPNSKLTTMSGLEQIDTVHITGPSTNELGQRFASVWAGSYGNGGGGDVIQAVRDVAVMEEAYVMRADSDSPPSLTVGHLNFNSTGVINTLRLHLESDDGNFIPWNKLGRGHSVIRISETSNLGNFIDLALAEWGKWDDSYPNTPNHIEYPVNIVADDSWVRPTNGSALTVTYRSLTLVGTAPSVYFTGLAGQLRAQADIVLANGAQLRSAPGRPNSNEDGEDLILEPGAGAGAGDDGLSLLSRVPHGGMISLGAAPVSSSTDWAVIQSWSAPSPSSAGCTADASAGTITIDKDGTYLAFASISATEDANLECWLGIFKNNIGTFSQNTQGFSAAPVIQNFSVVSLIAAFAGDVFDCRHRVTSGTGNFNMTTGQFMLLKIS